jgi:hypothetical protein
MRKGDRRLGEKYQDLLQLSFRQKLTFSGYLLHLDHYQRIMTMNKAPIE